MLNLSLLKLFKHRFVVLFLFSLLLAGCDVKTAQIELTGKTMGTSYSVKYVDSKNLIQSTLLQQKIDEALKQVNHQMSTYQKDSELSLFNQQQSSKPFAVSKDFAVVVAKAIELNKMTEGALDITVGPIVNLWGFGPDGRVTKEPTPQQIEKARERMGINQLFVDTTKNRLIKEKSDLYIDLSSIAKGFGVDKVAHVLEENGIQNYLVDIGGELRAKGVNGANASWRVAIEKPISGQMGAVQQIIMPKDKSVATSGDYRNYFEEHGIRYSHIIDPKTARPIQHHTVSVTIIADDCMTADGFATALTVLGDDEGYKLAQKLNIAVYFIVKTDKGFTHKYSDAFKPYLVGE